MRYFILAALKGYSRISDLAAWFDAILYYCFFQQYTVLPYLYYNGSLISIKRQTAGYGPGPRVLWHYQTCLLLVRNPA